MAKHETDPLDAVIAQLRELAEQVTALDEDVRRWHTVPAIGPHQLNRIDGDLVTVTYPAGADTVLSVQPDGAIETRVHGAQGAYETALLKVDRLVYAPHGAEGPVYLVPYAETIPNA